jgi:hypothetical protein
MFRDESPQRKRGGREGSLVAPSCHMAGKQRRTCHATFRYRSDTALNNDPNGDKSWPINPNEG